MRIILILENLDVSRGKTKGNITNLRKKKDIKIVSLGTSYKETSSACIASEYLKIRGAETSLSNGRSSLTRREEFCVLGPYTEKFPTVTIQQNVE